MPRFTYDESTHLYLVDGKPKTSVTGLLKEAGHLKGSNFYTEEARNRGTYVHLECLIDDLEDEPQPPHRDAYVRSYQRWKQLMQPIQWERLEQPTYSVRYDTTGTSDRIGLVRSHLTIVDFKTGDPAPWHGIQLAMYDLIYNDTPPQIRRRLALYLRDDGDCAKGTYYTSPSDYKEARRLMTT